MGFALARLGYPSPFIWRHVIGSVRLNQQAPTSQSVDGVLRSLALYNLAESFSFFLQIKFIKKNLHFARGRIREDPFLPGSDAPDSGQGLTRRPPGPAKGAEDESRRGGGYPS